MNNFESKPKSINWLKYCSISLTVVIFFIALYLGVFEGLILIGHSKAYDNLRDFSSFQDSSTPTDGGNPSYQDNQLPLPEPQPPPEEPGFSDQVGQSPLDLEPEQAFSSYGSSPATPLYQVEQTPISSVSYGTAPTITTREIEREVGPAVPLFQASQTPLDQPPVVTPAPVEPQIIVRQPVDIDQTVHVAPRIAPQQVVVVPQERPPVVVVPRREEPQSVVVVPRREEPQPVVVVPKEERPIVVIPREKPAVITVPKRDDPIIVTPRDERRIEPQTTVTVGAPTATATAQGGRADVVVTAPVVQPVTERVTVVQPIEQPVVQPVTRVAAPAPIPIKTVPEIELKEGLPKTGVPAAGWSLLSLIPGGFGLTRLYKARKENEKKAEYLWQKREFHKDEGVLLNQTPINLFKVLEEKRKELN